MKMISNSVISLVLAFLLITGSSLAQESIFNGCSSAGTIEAPVWFNCDFPDTFDMPVEDVLVNYMGEGDADFAQAAMSPVGELPYYEFTYETSVEFTTDPNILEFYFTVQGDTLMATQSPKNTTDQFPPSLYKYVQFVDDPIGDAENNPAGSWLDLTGSGMSYSDSRVYGYLDNVSNTWPLSQSLTYFVYALGFLVTTETDSLYYALAYGEVPLIMTSGLFKINMADTSFVRIGDISYNISGGLLHLACDLAEFENDPDWPGWPPPEGFLVTMGGTLSASLVEQNYNDFTYITIYEPQTQYLDFNANLTPVISDYDFLLHPDTGIVAQIQYRDGDNNLPVIRRLYFDSAVYDLGSFNHVYDDTSLFEAELPWPDDGWIPYYFGFSDGVDTVTTAYDSIYIEPSCYYYFPGDVNMLLGHWPPQVIGGDVTYLVGYFRGINEPCLLDGFYAAADVNGDCQVIGGDVTRLVSYFRGIIDLSWCPDYEPCWHDPEDPPPGWPNCDPLPEFINKQSVPADR